MTIVDALSGQQLAADVRVTIHISDGNHKWSIGLTSGPEVTLGGLFADLVRRLAALRPIAEVGITGPSLHLRAVRAFAVVHDSTTRPTRARHRVGVNAVRKLVHWLAKKACDT